MKMDVTKLKKKHDDENEWIEITGNIYRPRFPDAPLYHQHPGDLMEKENEEMKMKYDKMIDEYYKKIKKIESLKLGSSDLIQGDEERNTA